MQAIKSGLTIGVTRSMVTGSGVDGLVFMLRETVVNISLLTKIGDIIATNRKARKYFISYAVHGQPLSDSLPT